MGRFKYFLPLIIFALAAAAFYAGLGLNPKDVPSAKVGKPAPEFSLVALYDGGAPFSTADLMGRGVQLVNVFASWCVPCRVEHPILMALKSRGVNIYGLNYKDTPEAAIEFLDTLGDPYALVGQDLTGRVGIDWGVSGAPETYVVNNDGEIIFQHIGPLDRQVVSDKLLPLLEGGADE